MAYDTNASALGGTPAAKGYFFDTLCAQQHRRRSVTHVLRGVIAFYVQAFVSSPYRTHVARSIRNGALAALDRSLRLLYANAGHNYRQYDPALNGAQL